MGATSTEGTGSGAVENSFPRIQNNIKPQNLAGNVLGDITFDQSKIVGENGEIGFNTTPQGATIISPNGEITLVPNNTSSVIANGQYLRIYPTTAYDAPHIHITSGDGGDLLIGNDDRNLDVNSDDNIYIKTNQETTGYQWKFGKDATMNLPDLADSPSSQGDTGSLTRNGDVLYFKASGGWVPISTGLPSLGNFNPTAIVSYTDSVVPLPVHQISASDNNKLFILDKSENGFITLPVLSTTTIGQTFHFLTTVRPDQFFIQCYPFTDTMTGSLTLHKDATNDVRTFAASTGNNKIEYGTNNRTGGIIGSYVVATSLGNAYWIQGDVITSSSQTPSMPFGTNS